MCRPGQVWGGQPDRNQPVRLAKVSFFCQLTAAIVRGPNALLFMTDDFDDEEPLDPEAADDAQRRAEFEAELQRQVALVPPELYEVVRPLLMLASVANYQLMGYADDPVPQALTDLLGYDLDTVRTIAKVHDTPSLVRVMATQTIQLFDFIQVAQLAFESRLEEPLRDYLARHGVANSGPDGHDLRAYLLSNGEGLLENISGFLTHGNDDLGEELRLRRLQTQSIFARLDDTLRAYYPAGQSPEDEQAAALDAADEADDDDGSAVHVTFNEVQQAILATALRLPALLAGIGETAFARALGSLPRLRPKAAERLAERLAAADLAEPFGMSRSELLRLYQAAQISALSSVADVMATGSLEDLMAAAATDETPEEAATSAHHAREVMMAVLAGFVEVVEENHPDDEEIAAAKAEISQLAELLAE